MRKTLLIYFPAISYKTKLLTKASVTTGWQFFTDLSGYLEFPVREVLSIHKVQWHVFDTLRFKDMKCSH